MVLKEVFVKKARKDHDCNACAWLRDIATTSEYLFEDFNFTEEEKQAIIKAEQNGWRIKKGEPCIYRVGVWDGDFFAGYVIPEIDDICVKYDIYDE